MLGRYSSEITTGCANERPSGSVRGALGNWCPYRDQQQFLIWAVRIFGNTADFMKTFEVGHPPYADPSLVLISTL
jgi:hypothetical protein